MGHLRNFIRAITPNPFLKTLSKLPNKARICLFWNRGLGDIPLELYALIKTIRDTVKEAKITIITRDDLYQGFTLLGDSIEILTTTHLVRKSHEPYDLIFDTLKLDPKTFDHIFYKPDPAYWVKKQKKNLQIALKWNMALFNPLKIETYKPKAFLHVHSETVYGFEKNLPKSTWDEVISDLKAKGYYTIALGFNKHASFEVDLDLRGDTDLYQIISSLLDETSVFIGPDSGLLNILYYLDVQAKIHLISFWANTQVGLIKQGTSSPNKHLVHDMIIAKDQDLSKLNASQITEVIQEASFLKHLDLKKCPKSIWSLKDKVAQGLKTIQSLQAHKPCTLENALNPPLDCIEPRFEISCHICPIILAGGHGTRLGHALPKALFKVNGNTLLEHFIDKIKKAQTDLSKPLPVILMVSHDGYQLIVDYLNTHDYFGLDPKCLHIVIQDNYPFVTDQGLLVLKDESTLYEGPNGNGEVFSLLAKHGLFEMLDQEILGFEIIPIDNPLAPLFLKHHEHAFIEGCDVSLVCIKSENPQEKLGRVCVYEDKLGIIEYSENPPDHLNIANTGLIGFERSFAKTLSTKVVPIHEAHKTYPCFNGREYEQINVKKFETFIFDHLKWAKKFKIFTTSRSHIFQPLKEKQGPYGIEAVENALMNMCGKTHL